MLSANSQIHATKTINTMNYQEAHALATRIVEQLRPHCDRIEIAGSIRREHLEPNEIDIVCIPKSNAFGIRSTEFSSIVNGWEKVKGDPIKGRYTQRIVEGVLVDIFMCHELNWGYQLAIRTGSGQYSHKTLAYKWREAGFVGDDGMLVHVKSGKKIELREERDLFDLLNINYVEPYMRMMNDEKIEFIKKYGRIDRVRYDDHIERTQQAIEMANSIRVACGTTPTDGYINCVRCGGQCRYAMNELGKTKGLCNTSGCLKWTES